MLIRSFASDDFAAASALWQRTEGVGTVRQHELQRLVAVTPELVLVAEVDGAVIGTVLGSDDGRRGWIFRLAVDESQRGKGIGRALVQEVERRLLARGVEGVRLLVLDDNVTGRGFWERLGYANFDRMVMFGKDLVSNEDDAGHC